VVYSGYTVRQLSGLRELQNNLVDRNRRDSLQLLRIQDDLNSLGLTMRDMLEDEPAYPLTAWSAQLQRIRADLDNALQVEQQLAPTQRTPQQEQFLRQSLAEFWSAVDGTLAQAQQGKAEEARRQIRVRLQPQQAMLSNDVARLLVQNNESEEQASQQIREIYQRVERQVYYFLGATLAAILLTSLYVIYTNRQLFAQLAALSEQRSDLAQKLIATQESTLRHISRELHDEFGQILTAVGSMLGRAEKHTPEGSALREELKEVRDVTQATLDNVRRLSQALHPVMLDEEGLEATMDWYLATVEKQTGTDISYEKAGRPFPVSGSAGIHIYRVLQEALNNVTRHSGTRQAWVRLRFAERVLELEVEDRGKGFGGNGSRTGIGLVAMRERAELLGGTVEFVQPAEGGTLVRLRVPREKAEAHAE
jgi:signal transduction histidine kinase